MAIRPILRLGNPLLRQKSVPVDAAEIQSQEIQSVIADLRHTMQANHGLGLAAPQIGELLRIALVAIPENSERYGRVTAYPLGVYINPEWEIVEDSKQGYWEGCLSVPGLRGYVERPKVIQLRYLDEAGVLHEQVVSGFPAIVFQHEFDHLDGKLFVDRLVSSEKLAFQEEFVQFHQEMQK